jgi:hypothetical protein
MRAGGRLFAPEDGLEVVPEIGGGDQNGGRLGGVVELDFGILGAEHSVAVELADDFDIGGIWFGGADSGAVERLFGGIENVVDGGGVVDSDAAGIDAGDSGPELVGFGVEGVEVFIAFELDGESLFDNGTPNRVVAGIAKVEGRPAGVVVIGVEDVADLDATAAELDDEIAARLDGVAFGRVGEAGGRDLGNVGGDIIGFFGNHALDEGAASREREGGKNGGDGAIGDAGGLLDLREGGVALEQRCGDGVDVDAVAIAVEGLGHGGGFHDSGSSGNT